MCNNNTENLEIENKADKEKPTDYITKEQFLDNTREDEVFSLIHEFKERYNEMMKEENKQELVLLDEDIKIIADCMITEIKSQEWL